MFKNWKFPGNLLGFLMEDKILDIISKILRYKGRKYKISLSSPDNAL